MALIRCDFFSDVLERSTSMTVILPQTAKGRVGIESKSIGKRHPTLFLLHGLSDDDTAWVRRTSIERYAVARGLAVVMPDGERSFYSDMAQGPAFWTFVSDELPALARSFFPLSEKREETFAAGLSMGGYGAIKLALGRPDVFAAGASLSGALDVANLAPTVDEPLRSEIERIFGSIDAIEGTDNDLLHLAEKLAASDRPRPKLYAWCGTEDRLYMANVRMAEHLRRAGLDVTYEEGPGEHTWDVWDRQIQRVIDWLPLR